MLGGTGRWLGVVGSGVLWMAASQELAPEDAQEREAMKWQAYQMGDLGRQVKESGKAWLPFLDNDTLITGVYHLKAGAEDPQSPHAMDEVYHVVEGQASFEVAGERCEASPGTVLFVKAGAPHRFVDIREDLTVLVFFSKATAD